MKDVRYERQGPVALLTLDRPEALNAFDAGLRTDLRVALLEAAGDAEVRVLVLAAAGRGFSAGAELRGTMPGGAEVGRLLREDYLPGIRAIAEMPKPVVAAVHGFAAGIAVGYVLACDLVIIGEGAFLQVPFNRIGLVPDGGLCWQLASRLGHRRAFELVVTGERVSAARCEELGLANKVVPDDRVLEEALGWAAQLAAAPALATRLTKKLLREAPGLGFDATLDAETAAQQLCADSPDFAEGVEAFLSKRTPVYKGE